MQEHEKDLRIEILQNTLLESESTNSKLQCFILKKESEIDKLYRDIVLLKNELLGVYREHSNIRRDDY